MSNLIKASSVRYTDEIRKYDQNALADKYQKEFVDKFFEDNIALKQISFADVSKRLSDDPSYGDSFRPGLLAERLSYDDDRDDEAGGLLSSEDEAVAEEASAALTEEQMAELNEEADNILEEARQQAGAILEEARQQAEEERVKILAGAHDEGYQCGMDEAAAEAERMRAELEEKAAGLEAEYNNRINELEPAFTELVIKYVNKLTGIMAEGKRDIVLHLMDSVLKEHDPGSSFIIRVSPQEAEAVRNASESILGQLPEGARFEVIEDSVLKEHCCMIETDARIFECSLEEGLRELTEDLRLLTEKE